MRRAEACLAAIAVAAVASGCAGDSSEAATRQAAGPGGAGERVVPVAVAPVERGRIARSVTVSGVIEPIRRIGVNSQLSGALLSVHVQEGDVVRAGEPLARLDDRELRAQLAAAEASFQVAQAALARAEQLRERKVITIPEYERDRTAYAAARAQLDQLRTRAGYAVVEAPIGGVITEKRVEAGDVVAPQTRLFELADVSTLVVRVGVSELDVVELGEGDAVTLALDAFPGRSFRGRIRRVFPAADPSTRLVPVEVALLGEDARVARPGFLARVTFALGARDDVLLVPSSAIVSGAGSPAVFVVEDGHAFRRAVTTGLTSEGRVEVVSGLTGDDIVITSGNNMLRDGTAVRVVTEGGVAVEAAGSESARGAR